MASGGEKVVIAGGSGFVGSALTVELMKHGYSVVWISRSKKEGIRTITWDELKQDGLPDCKAVVNLCGSKFGENGHVFDDHAKIQMYSSRVETSRELVKTIYNMKHKPQVYVGVSGTGYYAAIDAAEHTEKSQGGKHDWISKMSHDWEESSTPLENQGIRRVIFRLGMVLGKDGGFSQMVRPFKMGLGATFGSGEQPFPWIHIHDVVKMMVMAIENNEMKGVYNGVAPDLITNEKFVHQLAHCLHKPVMLNIPEFVLKWAMGEEAAQMITHAPKVKPQHLQEQGFVFDFPDIQTALKDLTETHMIAHTSH